MQRQTSPYLVTSSADRLRTLIMKQQSLVIIWTLLVVTIVLAVTFSPYFSRPYNLNNLVLQSAALIIVSVGQTFVLLTAGIDLSVGATISLVVTLLARTMVEEPWSMALGIPLGLAAGALVGLINGVTITRLRINPFMATLATLSIVQGIAYILSTRPRSILPRGFSPILLGNVGPIPGPVILLLFILSGSAIIISHTRFGRHIVAVGSNEHATRLSGMDTDRVKVLVYMVSGLLAGLAGLFVAARSRAGDPLIGTNFPFDSITAAVLGGVSLFGGEGSVFGTLGGVLIIAILGNLLNIHGVSSNYQYVLRGALLVIATMLYSRSSRG